MACKLTISMNFLCLHPTSNRPSPRKTLMAWRMQHTAPFLHLFLAKEFAVTYRRVKKAITSWKAHKAATFWSSFRFLLLAFEVFLEASIHRRNTSMAENRSLLVKGNFTNFRAFSLLTPGCASIVMDFYFDAPRTVCFMTCSLKLIVMATIVSMVLGIMTFEERRTEKRCRAFINLLISKFIVLLLNACRFTFHFPNKSSWIHVLCMLT